MANYSFLTTWLLDAPRERVWDALYDSERWPEWWRGVESVVRLEEGDAEGVGAVYEHVWRSLLPYPVRFRVCTTRVERPHLIEGRADGELAGVGRWRLFTGSPTAVTYEWNVRTTRAWMNAVAPVARPIFAWNHNAVMRNGGRGLAGVLGASLIASD